jgi:hypothetical protein
MIILAFYLEQNMELDVSSSDLTFENGLKGILR